MPETSHADVLIVGGGMASERLLCQLGDLEYSGSVALISDEAEAGYNRVLLPDLLSGNTDWADMSCRSNSSRRGAWYETRLGQRVVALDLKEQIAVDSNGARTHWGKLVLATGSSAAIPQTLRVESAGIQPLRSVADVRSIEQNAQPGQTIAVIGGGLLGLEAAHALHQCGARVVVIHRSSTLMNRQLDLESGAILRLILERKGLEIRLGLEVDSAMSTKAGLTQLTLSDGSAIGVDRVVVATGNKANIDLASGAGLACRTGIVVNDALQTSDSSVYAIGECAEFAGATHCFVEPVFAQADALARRLCGESFGVALPQASARLKVAGVELFCAGQTAASQSNGENDQGTSSTVIRDPQAGIYRCLNFCGDVLAGGILLGDTHGSRSIFEHLGSRIDSALTREHLLFGTSTSHA